MKPRIFIGSSSEGKKKALFIKEHLSDVAVCELWDEGFFENNNAYLQALEGGATLFDFAIMVATKDDVQLKRDRLETIARDNIIFEFGLYIGRLGKSRSFFFKEKGLDLPSDLLGITLQEFTTNKKAKGKTLEEVCQKLKEVIEDISNTYQLSFVPSTVLAVGYFENFVSHVCRELMVSEKRMVDQKNFEEFKLHIVIPAQLPDRFQDQVIAYLSKKHLKEMKVETVTRKYNFYLDYEQNEGSVLELYDLPTTLSALKTSIEMAISKSYKGESKKENMLKQKEMFNFCRTLTYLVKENAITRDRVIIEFIDVAANPAE